METIIMKVTKSYIQKLIKEELEAVLKENESGVSGVFDLVPEGGRNMDSLAYYINGVSGRIVGRQSLLIAVDAFMGIKDGTGCQHLEPSQRPSLEETAQNVAGQWSNYLNREHGLEISPEQFKQALLGGDIQTKKNRPPQDTYISMN